MQCGLSTALHSLHTTGAYGSTGISGMGLHGCTPPRRAAPRASPRSATKATHSTTGARPPSSRARRSPWRSPPRHLDATLSTNATAAVEPGEVPPAAEGPRASGPRPEMTKGARLSRTPMWFTTRRETGIRTSIAPPAGLRTTFSPPSHVSSSSTSSSTLLSSAYTASTPGERFGTDAVRRATAARARRAPGRSP